MTRSCADVCFSAAHDAATAEHRGLLARQCAFFRQRSMKSKQPPHSQGLFWFARRCFVGRSMVWIDCLDLLVVLYPAHVRSSWPFLALLNRELDAITFA